MPVHPVVLSELALRHVREGAPRPPGQLTAAELPPVAASWADTRRLPVGSWKALRPIYERRVAPCLRHCPVGNDVEGFLDELRRGGVEPAVRLLLSENPLPAVCGRVCFHPCETACNRGRLDGAVSVRAVERWLGDAAGADPGAWESTLPATNKHVAVVGSGPAGLACAWVLRLLGHTATVLETRPLAGGLLRHGIPAYRLPKEILDRELRRLEALGVRFRCGIAATDLADLRGAHAAVFVATGAALGQSLGLAAEAHVLGALEFLASVAAGSPEAIGRRCLVIGGGNSAIDAARTARRFGADVAILYRRRRAEMPAFAAEVDEALSEGIELVELVLPSGIVEEEGGLRGLRCLRARLGEPDASGRPAPVAIPGSEFFVAADTIVNAIGEKIDRDVLTRDERLRRALGELDPWGAAAAAGVFAGGDFAGNRRTVADAIGSGKRAAMAIDRYLRAADGGAPGTPAAEASLDVFRVGGGPASVAAYLRGARGDVLAAGAVEVAFEDLNPAYFLGSPRREPDRRLSARPDGDFGEIESSFGAAAAREAAARCFSCGRCTACGNCFVFCPDGAIHRDPAGSGFVVHEAHCKGCGICVEECPRDAMRMQAVAPGPAS